MTARPAPLPPRTVPEILEAARRATCGQCWAYPLEPCAVPAAAGPGACHLARIDRAARRGVITAAEMAAVLAIAGELLSPAAVIGDTPAEVRAPLAALRQSGTHSIDRRGAEDGEHAGCQGASVSRADQGSARPVRLVS